MSAILATVDIEDLATPKIAAIKDSLSDLGRVQQDYARSQSALAGAATQSANALGANAVQTQAAAAGFNALKNQASGSQGALGALSGTLGQLKTSTLLLGLALKELAGGTLSYLRYAVDLSTRVETLGVVMAIQAKNARLSTSELSNQVEAIKRLGITSIEATEAVLQFVQADLKLADSSKLARVAQDLAVTAGINSSQAFDRLLRAINTQQPELLRSFGILTSMQQVMGKYAAENGKTARTLDALDRKQAVLNLILAEGAKAAGSYEASLTTAGKQLGTMDRLTEELAKKMGDTLRPAWSALVQVAFNFLEQANSAPPALYAIAAGLAVTTAGFIALRTAVVNMGPAFSSLMLLFKAHPVILLFAVAVGVLTAAWLAYNSATKTTVEDEQKRMSAAQASISTIERQRDKVLELQRQQAMGTASVAELDAAYAALAKNAPEAVNRINGEWRVNLDLVGEAIERQRVLMRLSLEAAEVRLTAEQKELAAARATFEATNKNIAALEKTKNALSPGRFRGQIEGMISAQTDSLAKTSQSIIELTAKVGTDIQRVADMRGELVPLQAAINGAGRAQLTFNDVVAKFDATKVVNELKKIGLSMDIFRDPRAFEDGGALFKALQEGLDTVDKSLTDAEAKAKAAAEKYKQAFTSAFEAITGTAGRTRATLDAANQAFKGLSESSDEYRSRLLRASGAIEQYNKSTEAQKRLYPDLAKAAKALEQVQLGEMFRGWSEEARKANESFKDVAREGLQSLADESAATAARQGFQLQRDRIDTVEKVRQLEEDAINSVATVRMTAQEREIAAEQKRLADMERNLAREKTLRDLAFQEEAAQLKVKFDLLRRAASERTADIRKSMRERAEQVNFELAAQHAEGKIDDTKLAARTAAFQQVQQFAFAQLQARETGYQFGISQEEAYQERLLQERREAADATDALTETSMVKVRAASAQTVAYIKDQYNVFKNLVSQVMSDTVASFTSGMGRMLTGAQSWAEGFKGILSSIKTSFFGFVDGLVQKWVQGGINQMLGRGTIAMSSGGKTGFGGLLQGLSNIGGRNPLAANSSTLAKLLSGIPGLTTTSLTGPTTSVIAGTGIPTTGATTLTALGTGAIAAGAGGLVGYNVGKLFKTRTKGALAGGLAGAGTGALIGATIGGPLAPLTATAGAIIGGIAGAIGGFFSGGKEAREVKKYRDELVAAQGGLEALKTKAKAAGFDLQKMMDTKKMKEFTAEAAKLDAVLKFGGMDELRKKAQLVGVDIDRIFAIKKAEDFNKEMEKLNGLLAAQEERLKGFQTAAAGLQNRAAGFQGAVTKDINTIYASLGTRTRETLQAAFVQAQKHGFSGTNLDFMVQKLKEVAEGGANIFNLPAGALAKYRKAVQAAQADFNKLGQYAAATFAGVLKETGDLNAAMEAVGPTLDLLIDTQDKLGLQTSDSLGKLLEFRKVLKVNQDVSQSLSGITQILDGLSKAGALTAEMFSTLGADATSQFDRLISRGVDADMAMLALQPTLQKLWEAQKKYGFAVDASTQSLIDQAVQQGLVGQQFQQTNEKILDVLLLIADALGATIPAALQNFQDSVDQTAPYAQDAFTGVALGNSPGGIREIVTQTNAAREALAAYRTQVANDSTAVSRDVMAAADSFKAFKFDPAALGGGSLGVSGALGGMFGLGGNPNGTTRDVSSMLRDLHERRNTPVPQVELETAPVEGEFVAPTLNEGAGTASSEGISIHIQMGDINIDASALDGQDIERVFRTQIVPQLVQDLDRNTGQLANNIEQRIARYRRAT